MSGSYKNRTVCRQTRAVGRTFSREGFSPGAGLKARGDGMRSFLRSVAFQIEQHKPDKVFVVTDDLPFVEALLPSAGKLPVLVATSNERVARWLDEKGVPAERIGEPPREGFHILEHTSSLLSKAFASGLLEAGEDVLAVIHTNLSATFLFNTDEVGLVNLRKEVADVIPPELLEVVMGLAFEVAHEGREGSHVGALFVLGDTEKALHH